MKPKTWWIIGAILFCLIVREPIVTLLVLLVLLVHPVLRLIEAAYDADHPDGPHYFDD